MATAALAVACADAPLTDARVAPPDRFQASMSGSSDAWNYVSVDIAVTREGTSALTARPGPAATAHARLEKWLDQGGWNTRVTLSPRLRTAADSATVASVVFDANGEIAGAFDAYGRAVPAALRTGKALSVTRLQEMAARLAGKQVRASNADNASPPRMTAHGIAPQTDARAWIDLLLVTPASAGRTVARLQRAYGSPVDWSASLDRYRAARNGLVREAVFNRDIGAVVEESVTDARGQVVRTKREFGPADGGTQILRRITTEYPAKGGGIASLVQEFHNLAIEAR